MPPSQTRVAQYPKPQALTRPVHAPCRRNSTPSSLHHPNNFDKSRNPKEREVIVVDHESIACHRPSAPLSINSFDANLTLSFQPPKHSFFHDNILQGSSNPNPDPAAEGWNKSNRLRFPSPFRRREADWNSEGGEQPKSLSFFPINTLLQRFKDPPHKNLYKPTTRKHTSKLSYLSAQFEILIKKFPFFGSSAKKSQEDLVREAFVQLTNDEEKQISQAFSNSNSSKVLVTHHDSNIVITGEVLQCLRPGAWLNDEVINLYLELLKGREKREPKKFFKCHFFNTFFYKKLISGKGGYDFKTVRRWTSQRKLGYSLIECDKIFVPIHKEIHWCLAVINRKDEKFQYLDSLKGKDSEVLEILARYYVDEVKDKSGKDIDISNWKVECASDQPDQKNGFDCGVFMLKYADFYSRGSILCFDQKHIPYFRKRIAKEILRLKAE